MKSLLEESMFTVSNRKENASELLSALDARYVEVTSQVLADFQKSSIKETMKLEPFAI